MLRLSDCDELFVYCCDYLCAQPWNEIVQAVQGLPGQVPPCAS